MARDVGPTQRFRPTGLALALLNEAVQGDMMAVSSHGADVSLYAFKSSESWAAVFVSALPAHRKIEFDLPSEARGLSRVRLHALISDAPEATNEDSEHIRIHREFLTDAGGKVSFNLPPWSIAVLLPTQASSTEPE